MKGEIMASDKTAVIIGNGPSRKNYTEKQFKKDLNQLNKLIGNFKSSKGSNFQLFIFYNL